MHRATDAGRKMVIALSNANIAVNRVHALYGDVVCNSKDETCKIIQPCEEITSLVDVSLAYYEQDIVDNAGQCRKVSENSINDYVESNMMALYDSFTGTGTVDEKFITALQGTAVMTIAKQDAGAADKTYLKSSIIITAHAKRDNSPRKTGRN